MKVHVDPCARRTYREDNEGCISARVCKWREFPTSTDRWKKFCGTKSSGNWISVRLKKYTTISSISIARASEEIFVRSFETALLVAKYRNRNIARVQREKKKNEAKRYFLHDIVCFNFWNLPLPLFSSRPHLFSPNTSQTLWFENAIQFYRVEWIIRIILCYVRISFLHGGTQTISPSFISESENLFSFLESFFKVGRPRRIENFFE